MTAAMEGTIRAVVGAAFEVSNELGHGFPEPLYQRAVEALTDVHVGQVLNYLRATNLHTGLLLNFGRPRVQYRKVQLNVNER